MSNRGREENLIEAEKPSLQFRTQADSAAIGQ
jgi:hypothetical protein